MLARRRKTTARTVTVDLALIERVIALTDDITNDDVLVVRECDVLAIREGCQRILRIEAVRHEVASALAALRGAS